MLALGLKKETADCCWSFNIGVYDESRRYTLVLGKCEYMHDIPAWSLHRLIDISRVHHLELWWHEGIYEQVISLIEERIDEGLINKEYLEE